MGWLSKIFGRGSTARPAASVPIAVEAESSTEPVRPPAVAASEPTAGEDIASIVDRLMAEDTGDRAVTDQTAERIITVETMREALNELGRLIYERGRVVDLAVYGGSCLMLVSNFRQASGDVDAVAPQPDQKFVEELAQIVGDRRGWKPDWLNDGVRGFLSEKVEGLAEHTLTATYPSEREPGLRVFVPTVRYMLAMKLSAMRIGIDNDKDLDDIISLMMAADISSKEDLVKVALAFYPVREIGGKLYAALESLWGDYVKRKETEDADPPRYLG